MGLKFCQLSDLHLEFASFDLPGRGDVLLLGGDIVTVDHLRPERSDKDANRVRSRMNEFVDDILQAEYSHVFHVMGNHEHYHGIFDHTAQVLQDYYDRRGAQHVKVLDKESAQITEKVRIWGGTFWTSFGNGNPMIMNAARLGMNDYNAIRLPNTMRRFQPEIALEDHQRAFAALRADIEEYPESHWIVMTHMGPSWQSVDERFRGDMLNYCYVTDLEQFIIDHPQINVWTHGHTHTSHYYHVGETAIICNPRGYMNHRGECENPTFSPLLTFEINYDNKKNNTSFEAADFGSLQRNCS